MRAPDLSPGPSEPSAAAGARWFCSRQARAMGEQAFGTAAVASSWLLIEVPTPWSRKVLRENALPEAVQEQLRAWDKAHGSLRIQFIRRRVNTWDQSGHIAAYVAHLTPQERRCYALPCRAYEEVLGWDVPAWVQGTPPASAEGIDVPLFFTCTNGKRDACCAKWGLQLHDAIRAVAPTQAWQTTHLGGHRFAPTVLTLPHGIHYGWLDEGDAALLIDAHHDGRVHRLDAYRGCVVYERPTQAADYYLRRHLAEQAVDALVPDASYSVDHDDGTYIIRFHHCPTDTHYEVQISEHLSHFELHKSCGDAEMKPVPQYTLEGISPLGARAA